MFIKGTSGVGSHPKLHTYEEGYLLPVLKGSELLFGQRHKGLLRQLRDLAELPPEDFDRSYGQLIQNFLEFVQVLPHKPNGILGSLCNYSLARATITFQKYCHARRLQTSPLLKFAVFSAALLQDVALVMANQRIILVNDADEFVRDWNPFAGSLLTQTKFYKMYPISASYFHISAEVTPMLAKQLLSNELFLWLSDDLTIFSDWLSALLGQPGDESKQITFAVALIKRDDIFEILNTLDGALVDMQEPTDLKQAEDFFQWLKKGIATSEIAINTDDALVHVVQEGVLIERQLFKQYVDLYRLPIDYMKLAVLFGNLLGIPKKGGNDYMHAFYLSGNDSAKFTSFTGGMAQKGKTTHEGLIVDPQLLLLNKETSAKISAFQSAKMMVSMQQQFPLQANLAYNLRKS